MEKGFEERVLNGKKYYVEKGLLEDIRIADGVRGEIQVFIDLADNKMWGVFQTGGWSKYKDKSIISIGFFADRSATWEDLETQLKFVFQIDYYDNLVARYAKEK